MNLEKITAVIAASQRTGLAQQVPSRSQTSAGFDIDRWIEAHNIPLTGRNKEADGVRYIGVQCPWNDSHEDAAIIVRADGSLGFKCFHDSCADKGWKTYRVMYELDAYSGNFEETESASSKKSQADVLLTFLEKCELFVDELREPFAKVCVASHYEVWPVKSERFRLWLTKKYYEQTKRVCNSEALNQAIGVACAKGIFAERQVDLYLRCAANDGAIWYDLADSQWQAVKVTADSWSIEAAPVLFRRFPNTAPQVMPVVDGSIERLRPFVNFKEETDFQLLAVYLVSCLVPGVPKVALPVSGERGASKSTMLRILRKLVDPAKQELLTFPRDCKELALSLYTNYMPAFDNMSRLNQEQSDMLCCAATGGGISKRKLYTDDGEVILDFLRPVVLNGITQVATKPDLLDRSVLFELERVPEEQRMPEREFWRNFEAARPAILGGMFDILAKAMSICPLVKLKKLPRMADFALWGYAIAEAMGWSGEAFLAAYYKKIGSATEDAIRNNPVAYAIVEFMRGKRKWQGTAAQLLVNLNDMVDELQINRQAASWPKAANVLSRRLVEHKANFAEVGLEYRKEKDSHTKMDVLCFQWALSVEEVSPQPPQCPSVATKLLDMPGFDEEGVMRM